MKIIKNIMLALLIVVVFMVAAMMTADITITLSDRYYRAGVCGTSMLPTLNEDSTLIVDSEYDYSDLQPGDIICAKITKEQLNDPDLWVWYLLTGRVRDDGTLHIVKRIDHITEDGNLYILGDNAAESVDSRNFGSIDTDSYNGKVIFYYNFIGGRYGF